eukprot:m51a1_g3636 hypothetical protein (210) ;mRNA; f:155004-155805
MEQQHKYLWDVAALVPVADAETAEALRSAGAEAPAVRRGAPIDRKNICAALREVHERKTLHFSGGRVTLEEVADAELRVHEVCAQHISAQRAQPRDPQSAGAVKEVLATLTNVCDGVQRLTTSVAGTSELLEGLHSRVSELHERWRTTNDLSECVDEVLAQVSGFDAVLQEILRAQSLITPEAAMGVRTRAEEAMRKILSSHSNGHNSD